jgi:ATP-binding protein involved in chromosome partitioning
MFFKKKPAENDERLLAALATVNDPELHQSLVALNMVKKAVLKGTKASITIELTTPACPLKDTIRGDIEAAIEAAVPGTSVEVEWTAQVRNSRFGGGGQGGPELPGMEGVKNVLLVASGKGGVGKSTVAVNLACALSRTGARVGLLDADIYGPSVPTMTNQFAEVTSSDGKTIDPLPAFGLKLMSMGFFISPNKAMIWRGPMLHSAVTQFLRDVNWGELDYLVCDLPPGTGDVQLTFSQALKVTGAIIVSTPQTVAIADVIRAQKMFETVDIPVLGLVENMAWFECDGCTKKHYIFANGGARNAAAELGVDFLGELPIDLAVREGGDRGLPVVEAQPDTPVAQAFMDLARNVAGKASVLGIERAAAQPPPVGPSTAGKRSLPIIG